MWIKRIKILLWFCCTRGVYLEAESWGIWFPKCYLYSHCLPPLFCFFFFFLHFFLSFLFISQKENKVRFQSAKEIPDCKNEHTTHRFFFQWNNEYRCWVTSLFWKLCSQGFHAKVASGKTESSKWALAPTPNFYQSNYFFKSISYIEGSQSLAFEKKLPQLKGVWMSST